MWWIILLLMCMSCTDLLLQDNTKYNSIQLNGNAWIHIENDVNDDVNDISVMNNAFTLEFWFTGGNSGDSESACLLSIIDDNSAIKFGLFKDPLSPNSLEVWWNDERLDPISLNLDEDLNSGSKFHHIAITSDENIQIYLDGTKIDGCTELDQTACEDETDFLDCVWITDHCETGELGLTYSGISINIDENDLVIGGKVNRDLSTLGRFWTGNIDEMRLWSSVLNATIIAFHYNNPEKLAESYEEIHVTSLTALWRFQFEAGETSPIIPDESCSIITQIYTNTPSLCSNVNDAIIYTLGNDVVTFSEKHP